MEKIELDKELEFIRKQIQIFRGKADNIENGNWRRNVSDDFDKNTIWSHYKRIISALEYLLRNEYDAER